MRKKLTEGHLPKVKALLVKGFPRKTIAKELQVNIRTLGKFIKNHLPEHLPVFGVVGEDTDLFSGDVWVVGYEKLYAVNEKGEVISYRNKRRKILKGGLIYSKNRGAFTYRVVCLTGKDGKPRSEYVHRLIAETLLTNPNNYPCVNHKNLDKLDNRLVNLEWVTFSENTVHGYEQGAWEESLGLRREKAKKISLGLIDSELNGNATHYYRDSLEQKDFIEYRVPPEMLKVSVTRGDYKSQWKFFVSLFRDCDNSDNSLSFIAKKYGIDQSYVSYIRNGFRMKKARKIYNKYKDDQYYTDYI